MITDNCLSDHNRIYFTIGKGAFQKVEFRNPKNTDWGEFDFRVQQDFIDNDLDDWLQRDKFEREDIDLYCNTITNTLVDAYESSSPLIVRQETTNTKWWNKKLHTMRKNMNKTFRKAKRNLLNVDYENIMADFKLKRKDYKKAILKAKSKSWQAFCESTKDISCTAKLQKLLCKDKSAKLTALIDKHGNFSETNCHVLDILIDAHFNGALVAPNIGKNTDLRNEVNVDLINKIITQEKIEWAVSKFEKYKTAGPDCVFPGMLQSSLYRVLEHLTLLYRQCLINSYIPKAWKEVNVIFIPKPGKSSYYDPKAYRPISLSSFMLKTLERMIDAFIRDETLQICPLSTKQHGYMPGRSTESALIELTDQIMNANQKGEFAMAAFLDIAGAFDNTNCSSITESLKKRCADPCITSIIEAILLNRKVKLEFEGETTSRYVTKGCPQGGVLSPILWNIVVDEIIELLNSSGIYCQGYADDIVILIKGKHLNTMSELLNNAFRKIESWCVDKGLTVNPSKTELVLFTNKRNKKLPTNPTLFNKELSLSTSAKYLGIILDSKLNWNKHVTERIKKANNILWQCRRAIAPKWGLDPQQMKWIYTAIVRPMTTYGCIVWYNYITAKSHVIELSKLNRVACRMITGCMKSTPSAALELVLDVEPLDIFIENTALAASYRLASFLKRNRQKETNLLQILNNLLACSQMPSDMLTTKIIFEKSYSTVIMKREICLEKHSNNTCDNISKCFTDGSVSEEGVGAGYAIYDSNKIVNKKAISLGNQCNIFQAEIAAIMFAARSMMDFNNRNIVIFSDSQAAILALASWEFKSKLVIQCVQTLNMLGATNTCTIEWVPGHSGIKGNEQADSQAKIGAATKFIGPLPVFPVSFVHIKSELCKIKKEKICKRWNRLETCRQTKLFFPVPDITRSNHLMTLSRQNMKLIVSMITGHCDFRKHLNVMGLSDEPSCPKCGSDEDTPEHFYLTCSFYKQTREVVFGPKKTDTGTSLLQCTTVWDLLRFAKTSGRFHSEC